MKWVEDKSLTKEQSRLKWYIHIEFEFEYKEDIKAVLESLLKDVVNGEKDDL